MRRAGLAFALGMAVTTPAAPLVAAGTATSCGTWRPVWSPNPSPPGGHDDLVDVAVLSPANVVAVGGASKYRGGQERRGRPIAERWDGSAWTMIRPVSPDTFGSFAGIARINDTSAWAVGYSSGDGSNKAPLIERLSGDTWTVVPSPHVGGNSWLRDVDVVSATDAWALGEVYDADSYDDYTLAMHWDGTAWTIVPTSSACCGEDGFFAVDMRTANDGWAVGWTDLQRWNGSAWTVVPRPLDVGVVSVVAVSASKAFAVGTPFGASGQAVVLRWDGTSWKRVHAPAFGAGVLASLSDVTVTPGGSIYAVGRFTDAAELIHPLVVRWDGTAWARMRVSTASLAPGLFGVAAVSDTDVITVGSRARTRDAEGRLRGSMTFAVHCGP